MSLIRMERVYHRTLWYKGGAHHFNPADVTQILEYGGMEVWAGNSKESLSVMTLFMNDGSELHVTGKPEDLVDRVGGECVYCGHGSNECDNCGAPK